MRLSRRAHETQHRAGESAEQREIELNRRLERGRASPGVFASIRFVSLGSQLKINWLDNLTEETRKGRLGSVRTHKTVSEAGTLENGVRRHW